MSAPTVPSSHASLPAQPDSSQASNVSETNASLVQHANNVAAAKLRQKNRRQNRMEVEFPVILQFEAGTAYTFQGFTPDLDGRTLICDEVEIRISGKRGSVTRAGFYVPPEVV